MAQQCKRGLVLAGGGAKGAYQFGFLRALKKYGVRVDAVAGTSVGALNAAVWATGRMDQGAQLWANLSTKTTYPYRRYLGFIALLFLMPAHLAASHVDNSLEGVSSAAAKLISDTFTVLFVICFLPATYRSVSQDTDSWILALFVSVLAFFALSIGPQWPWFRQMVVVGSFPLAAAWLIDVIQKSREKHAPTLGGIPEALMGAFAVVVVAAFLISRLPFSSRTAAPLRKAIADILEGAVFSIPTYVTAAVKLEFTDPDNVQFFEMRSYGSSAPSVATQESKRMYFPKYYRLNDVSQAERLELLAASAALPFGVVPAVQYRTMELVDGGVVDNVPAYPLIESEQCDELIIVRLDSDRDSSSGDRACLEEWQRIRRLFRIIDVPRFRIDVRNPPSSRQHDPPVVIPFEQPTHWPQRVIVCKPGKSLGGFFDGTLNFEKGYARRLITMGERDAEEVVASHWPELRKDESSSPDCAGSGGD